MLVAVCIVLHFWCYILKEFIGVEILINNKQMSKIAPFPGELVDSLCWKGLGIGNKKNTTSKHLPGVVTVVAMLSNGCLLWCPFVFGCLCACAPDVKILNAQRVSHKAMANNTTWFISYSLKFLLHQILNKWGDAIYQDWFSFCICCLRQQN